MSERTWAVWYCDSYPSEGRYERHTITGIAEEEVGDVIDRIKAESNDKGCGGYVFCGPETKGVKSMTNETRGNRANP